MFSQFYIVTVMEFCWIDTKEIYKTWEHWTVTRSQGSPQGHVSLGSCSGDEILQWSCLSSGQGVASVSPTRPKLGTTTACDGLPAEQAQQGTQE